MKRPIGYGLSVWFSNEYIGDTEEKEIAQFVDEYRMFEVQRRSIAEDVEARGRIFEYIFYSKHERKACIKEVRRLAYEEMSFWNMQREETP